MLAKVFAGVIAIAGLTMAGVGSGYVSSSTANDTSTAAVCEEGSCPVAAATADCCTEGDCCPDCPECPECPDCSLCPDCGQCCRGEAAAAVETPATTATSKPADCGDCCSDSKCCVK